MTPQNLDDALALLDELIAESARHHPSRSTPSRILLRRHVRAILPDLYRFADQWDRSERFTVVVAPRSDQPDC